jgi:hypothetical protein
MQHNANYVTSPHKPLGDFFVGAFPHKSGIAQGKRYSLSMKSIPCGMGEIRLRRMKYFALRNVKYFASQNVKVAFCHKAKSLLNVCPWANISLAAGEYH